MIDKTAVKINELLARKKVKPQEISIVTPLIDEMLKFTLQESLSNQVNPIYLSGSEKLIQNKIIFSKNMLLYDGYRYIKEK